MSIKRRYRELKMLNVKDGFARVFSVCPNKFIFMSMWVLVYILILPFVFVASMILPLFTNANIKDMFEEYFVDAHKSVYEIANNLYRDVK